jgi:hypothetical protein
MGLSLHPQSYNRGCLVLPRFDIASDHLRYSFGNYRTTPEAGTKKVGKRYGNTKATDWYS